MPAMCSPLMAKRWSVPVAANAARSGSPSRRVRPSIVAVSKLAPRGSSQGNSAKLTSSAVDARAMLRAHAPGGSRVAATRVRAIRRLMPCERCQSLRGSARSPHGLSSPLTTWRLPGAGRSPVPSQSTRRRAVSGGPVCTQPDIRQASPSRASARSTSTKRSDGPRSPPQGVMRAERTPCQVEPSAMPARPAPIIQMAGRWLVMSAPATARPPSSRLISLAGAWCAETRHPASKGSASQSPGA